MCSGEMREYGGTPVAGSGSLLVCEAQRGEQAGLECSPAVA